MEGTAPADGTEQAGSGVIKLQACAGVMASASLWWPGSPHQLLGPPAGLGAGAVYLPHHRPQTTHHVISVFPLHLGEVHAAVVGAPSLFPFFVQWSEFRMREDISIIRDCKGITVNP